VRARFAIGLDVGGTKIAGGVVDAAGSLHAELTEPTPEPSDGEAVTAVLVELVERLREREPAVEAVGLGAAGIVDWPSGRVVWAPNNAYRDWPVRNLLQQATGLPVTVDNDANVATLAEARLGRGRYHDMALVTVGTGIGGGLLLGDALYRGRTGRGAEIGHIVVDPAGPPCACGNRGCLEAHASGTALGRMGRDAAAGEPDGLIARLGAAHGGVSGPTVTAAALQGDPTARRLFDRLGSWLGVGIASLTTIFELDVVVVGGGLVETGELLLAPARAAAREFAYAPSERGVVPVVAATRGGEAGLVGAALLALDHHAPG